MTQSLRPFRPYGSRQALAFTETIDVRADKIKGEENICQTLMEIVRHYEFIDG